MFKEFKEFAVKGNVVDMAVGIIIGAAFTSVVRSLVDDIIMPPIGALMGGVDFSNIFINLTGGTYATVEEAAEAGAATINIGIFVNAIISFLLVAWAVFFLVKGINQLKKDEEKKEDETPPKPSEDIVLLQEIRDLLAKGSS